MGAGRETINHPIPKPRSFSITPYAGILKTLSQILQTLLCSLQKLSKRPNFSVFSVAVMFSIYGQAIPHPCITIGSTSTRSLAEDRFGRGSNQEVSGRRSEQITDQRGVVYRKGRRRLPVPPARGQISGLAPARTRESRY